MTAALWDRTATTYRSAGVGVEWLYGDAGANRFIFQTASDNSVLGRDTIGRFFAAEGDGIDLSQTDANALLAGPNHFSYVGSDPFTAAGQLRFERGVLSGDVNGDGRADFAVDVMDWKSLIANRLIL